MYDKVFAVDNKNGERHQQKGEKQILEKRYTK